MASLPKVFTKGQLVNSKSFGFIISLAIVINAIVIGLETDFACVGSTCKHPDDFIVWIVLENLFLGIFFVEVVLKMYALSMKGYWSDPWNRFDFLLVAISMVDMLAGVVIGSKTGIKIIQVLRVLRVFRLVRLVKLLRQFKELYLLVNGMVEAAKTLVWLRLRCCMKTGFGVYFTVHLA